MSHERHASKSMAIGRLTYDEVHDVIEQLIDFERRNEGEASDALTAFLVQRGEA